MGFSFENKRHVGLLVVLVVLIWLVFPFLFKAFMFWMEWVGVDLETFAAYGPVGDIYGSLNTLFTSATLAFVIYSTILQRQANKDARDAMADQLQQAKDATAEQLQQAKDATAVQLQQARDALDAQLKQASEATEQQITNAKELANTQLEHARESTERQLALAQATHDAQMLESRNAIFASKFYGLLNLKKDKLNNIEINILVDKSRNGQELFKTIKCIEAIQLLQEKFNELTKRKEYDVASWKELRKDFFSACNELKIKEISSIIAYFYTYIDILELVKNETNLKDDIKFYQSIVSNSMFLEEQEVLFWICPMFGNLKQMLNDSQLFNMFAVKEEYKPYALVHHHPSHFKGYEWKKVFEEQKEKTPA